MRSHCDRDIILYGDGWRGYSQIAEHYTLKTVNHSVNFVDPENPQIHTNNIERFWRTLKNEIRGVGIENLDVALKCVIFKKTSCEELYLKRCKFASRYFLIKQSVANNNSSNLNLLINFFTNPKFSEISGVTDFFIEHAKLV